MNDIIVVGGGPAGTKTGALLSKDHDVIILEEHQSSGAPAQCTGLISERTVVSSGVKPTILSRLSKARFHFPDGNHIDIDTGSVKAVLVDRTEFDTLMAERAMDNGCDIRYNTRYLSHSLSDGNVNIVTDKGELSSKVIIGADGYSSKVASSIMDNGPKEYVRGIQYDIKKESDDKDMIELFFGNEVAPGFFGWAIPFGEYTRVGLCTKWEYGPPMDYMRSLLKRHDLSDYEIVRKYCGKIPLGDVRRTYSDNLLLVGDAASQVKAVSGGGVYPALEAAECAADTVREAFLNNDFSESTMSSYERGWKSRIGKELRNSYRIHGIYSSMTDAEYNRMYPIFNNDRLIADMASIDIDDPWPATKRLLRHPVVIAKMLPVFMRAVFR